MERNDMPWSLPSTATPELEFQGTDTLRQGQGSTTITLKGRHKGYQPPAKPKLALYESHRSIKTAAKQKKRNNQWRPDLIVDATISNSTHRCTVRAVVDPDTLDAGVYEIVIGDIGAASNPGSFFVVGRQLRVTRGGTKLTASSKTSKASPRGKQSKAPRAKKKKK
jgi:hypothetical protein